METFATDNQGSYATATAAALQTIEPTLNGANNLTAQWPGRQDIHRERERAGQHERQHVLDQSSRERHHLAGLHHRRHRWVSDGRQVGLVPVWLS